VFEFVFKVVRERSAVVANMPLRARITSTTTDKMASSSSEDLLKAQLDQAVEEGKVPQAVVFAGSRDGSCFPSLY
jgi:hypothetical protein